MKKQKKCNGTLKEEEKKSKAGKKGQKKLAEEPPTGYIHVRARRGQATDSHSLAERVQFILKNPPIFPHKMIYCLQWLERLFAIIFVIFRNMVLSLFSKYFLGVF